MKTVAKTLVYDPSGKVLVLRRSNTHPDFPEHLDFPGGEIEDDEHPEQAVARELLEETSIQLPPNSLHLAFEKSHGTQTKHLFFICKFDKTPDVSLSWEHVRFYWLTLYEILNEPMPPGVDAYYKDVVDYLAQS